MSTKLSPTQEKAVAYLRDHGGTIWRWPGGFWTDDIPIGGGAVPNWYISTPTVYALDRKGVLERTNEYPERWRDTRKLAKAWR